AASGRIEYVSVVQGRGKIRMIQNVEKLGTELRIEAIRDPLDVVVLEQGEIEVRQSWSNECVSSQVAAKCNGIGDREALRLDVADGIPRIHRRTATWTGNQVRNTLDREIPLHNIIPARIRIKRATTLLIPKRKELRKWGLKVCVSLTVNICRRES